MWQLETLILNEAIGFVKTKQALQETKKMKKLTLKFGLYQVIKKPTHIRYFFFMYQPNLDVTTKFDN